MALTTGEYVIAGFALVFYIVNFGLFIYGGLRTGKKKPWRPMFDPRAISQEELDAQPPLHGQHVREDGTVEKF